MKKLLFSLFLLAGMVLAGPCMICTEDVHEPTSEIETVEPVLTCSTASYMQVVLQDLTKTENIVEETNDIPTSSYDWSEDESYLLAKIAMAEAEGENTEGKALVMLVVLNRVCSDGFPDTIQDVLFQKTSSGKWQFSPMQEGGRWYTIEPNEDCYAALALIMSGWDESERALYFEATYNGEDTWQSRNLEYIKTVGSHNFYK